jgi:hypothetical protein
MDSDHGLEHAAMERAERARQAPRRLATTADRRLPPSPFRHLYARAVRIAAEPCGALVVREVAKVLQRRLLRNGSDGARTRDLRRDSSKVTGRKYLQIADFCPNGVTRSSPLLALRIRTHGLAGHTHCDMDRRSPLRQTDASTWPRLARRDDRIGPSTVRPPRVRRRRSPARGRVSTRPHRWH